MRRGSIGSAILEQIKHAAAAAQAGEIVRFARSQVAAQRQAGVNYRRLGQGIAEQIGLACHLSGWHGARRLTLARDLVQSCRRPWRRWPAARSASTPRS